MQAQGHTCFRSLKVSPTLHADLSHLCLAREKQWEKKILGMPYFPNSAPALLLAKMPYHSGTNKKDQFPSLSALSATNSCPSISSLTGDCKSLLPLAWLWEAGPCMNGSSRTSFPKPFPCFTSLPQKATFLQLKTNKQKNLGRTGLSIFPHLSPPKMLKLNSLLSNFNPF